MGRGREGRRRVVESGKHRLISDYETVWKNTCNGIWDAGESLIEVSFYSPTGLDSDNTAGRIGKWNGVSATTVEGERGRNAANWKVTYNFTRRVGGAERSPHGAFDRRLQIRSYAG